MIPTVPATEDVPVIRIDFSDDLAWQALCKEMVAPVPFNESVTFQANLSFVDDRRFEGLSVEQLVSGAVDQEHPIILVVDTETLHHTELPVLCVDVVDSPGQTFRFIPSVSWSVENNLSLANMDFEEFEQLCDSDGVFRGIDDPSNQA